jgi:hypothetical protein
VLLWPVGQPGSLVAAEGETNHNVASVAADATGRLWVFYTQGGSSGPHVFARRWNGSDFEFPVDLGAPPDAQAIYALDGDVSPAGDPEALALAGFADGSSGTYWARGPQTGEPPPPVNGKSVNVALVSGTVLVKPPGSKTFVPLTGDQQIPVGSTVDATKGRVRLQSATGATTRATTIPGGIQSAELYAGAFTIKQQRGKPETTLRLAGGNASTCRSRSFRASRKRGRVLRRLWGSGKGRFKTDGRYASATVRGTIWLTEDRCNGTLIRVNKGLVRVADKVRHRFRTLRAQQSYFAFSRR